MDLLTRIAFLRYLDARQITWDRYGYGSPTFQPGIRAWRHCWRTVDWEVKRYPRFLSLLMGTVAPWEQCVVAKCHPEYRNPYFDFEEDCPVMGTDCLVNPLSIDEDDDVDLCCYFDSFCLDHWSRMDAVRQLPIPPGFTGVLRFTAAEAPLVESLLLMVMYAGSPRNDMMVFPDHGQQILTFNHEAAVAVICRDAAWGQAAIDLLAAQGFTA